MKSESAMLYRWAAALEDYEFEIKHRPGSKQGHVDGLSSVPIMEIRKQKKRTLNEQETREALERIHQDGHLGTEKMLDTFRKRFEGEKD